MLERASRDECVLSRVYDAGIKGFVGKETKITVIVFSCPSPFIVGHTFTDLALTHSLSISLPSLLSSKLPLHHSHKITNVNYYYKPSPPQYLLDW